MVPKALCATFNHRWGKLTELRQVRYRPVSAAFSGMRVSGSEQLTVICEQVEVVTTTCDGCNGVKRVVLKENPVPLIKHPLIPSALISKEERENPLKLVCAECSNVLRLHPSVGRICLTCNPKTLKEIFNELPPQSGRDYLSKWIGK